MSKLRIKKYNKLIVAAVLAGVQIFKEFGLEIDDSSVNSILNTAIPLITVALVFLVPNKE